MSRVKNFSIRFAALIIALVVAVVAFSAYGSSQDTNAAYSTRYYRRHYFNNANSASYTTYSLSVEEKTRSASSTDGMMRDNDKAVVYLSNGGSGFIVGKHIVATAGHCVYNLKTSTFKDTDIQIIDENNQIINTISPKFVDICSNYATDKETINSTYDYALLYVEQDLSEYGAFSLGIMMDSYISRGGTVIASGFPSEMPPGYSETWQPTRFRSAGVTNPTRSNSFIIAHDAATTDGDSGGPLYIEEGFNIYSGGKTTLYEYKTVVGITSCGWTNGDTGETFKAAVRINEDILKFYRGNTTLPA